MITDVRQIRHRFLAHVINTAATNPHHHFCHLEGQAQIACLVLDLVPYSRIFERMVNHVIMEMPEYPDSTIPQLAWRTEAQRRLEHELANLARAAEVPT